MTLPHEASAVVIGGGVSGASVAYHLAQLGWRDVVLLERRQLTCGTTWHAAGLIAQLRASQNMTRLAKYSQELYGRLEAETGVATGFRRCGSITVALTPARREEILRQASMARAFGVEVEEIGTGELGDRYPHLRADDVTGAVWLPLDGQADPTGITQALAKGARMNGATVFEHTRVADILTQGDRITGVVAERDGERTTIATPHVVNCAGMWAREVAAMARGSDGRGARVPLHACEHFYIVTEAIPGLAQLPVLRVPDECAYYKEDAGKMLVGAFEPNAKPWGMTGWGLGGIPADFSFDELPPDFDHFEPILERAVERVPMLAETGIHTFFNGPESFTPDDRYHLGADPTIEGLWVAAGYNSVGIQSSGGAGMALAAWMDEGTPPFDLWEVDIRRTQPFQNNRTYLRRRASEALGLLYADHWPHRQFATARGVRRTPLHTCLDERGAVWGETAGWERANWFAAPNQKRAYEHTWGRPNWFANQRREHEAVREGCGLFDLSTFGKIRVEGRDALSFLLRVCSADLDVPVGRIVYTTMLNARGGIEGDLTVTRLAETAFLLVVPAATVQRDLAWLRRHVADDFAVITDLTAGEAVIALMGPRSRELLALVSPHDWSNESHPFGHAAHVEVGLGEARAHRVSYVGELGWELYVAADQAAHVFEAVWEAGADVGLQPCGMHALDSARIEKAFRHFGHDITDEDHVLEAGLGFAARKTNGYIGSDAVARMRDEGVGRRLLQFRLSDADEMLFHNEAISRDGEVVGQVTSGNYGHTLGGAIGLGYVPCGGESAVDVLASDYAIEIAGRRVAAEASLKAMYDPKGERMRV